MNNLVFERWLLSVCCRSQSKHFSSKIRTPLPACFCDCFCLFRLDTSIVVKVRPNPLTRQTVRWETLILSLSHLQIKDCLMGILCRNHIRSWIGFRESRLSQKRSKLLTRTILCNCLPSSFYCAGASIPRTAFWVVSSVVRI